MADGQMLSKRVAISKANAQTVIVVAVAAFITVFCLVASKSVWSQNSYQARVTSAKEKAHNQLVQNINAYDQLTKSYKKFVTSNPNVINGQTNGTAGNDGDNAKIVLDALPPSYDFPALTSSLEKLLSTHGFKVSSISGTDDQINQQANTSSATPQPVPMPFSISVSNTTYASIGQLVTALQQSIRPIQIDTIGLSGGSTSMTMTVAAHTYYQPSKSLTITKQAIK